MSPKKTTEGPKKARDWTVLDQEYEVVPIESIKPHPKNPNKGDVEVIRESIRTNTFYGVVTCQRSKRRILAGEHRWRAARAEGLTEIAVVWKDVDDVEAIRIMLVDNESARQGQVDPVKVMTLLDSLADIDETGLEGTGFGLADLETMHDEIEAELEEQEGDEEEEPEDDGLFEPDDYDPDGVGVKYGILIMCDDEAAQAEMFDKLTGKWKVPAEQLRVVAV